MLTVFLWLPRIMMQRSRAPHHTGTTEEVRHVASGKSFILAYRHNLVRTIMEQTDLKYIHSGCTRRHYQYLAPHAPAHGGGQWVYSTIYLLWVTCNFPPPRAAWPATTWDNRLIPDNQRVVARNSLVWQKRCDRQLQINQDDGKDKCVSAKQWD